MLVAEEAVEIRVLRRLCSPKTPPAVQTRGS